MVANEAVVFNDMAHQVAGFDPRVAEERATKRLAAGNSLTNFPYRGRSVRGANMRERLIGPNPVIRYEVIRDAVQVLRIRHSARRSTRP